MPLCEGCSAEVPGGALVCPACGMPAGSDASTLCDVPTPAAGGLGASSGKGEPRFATGAVLASRYRIVTVLGQGGMGEVYRADDLKLRQTVALKFLRPSRAGDRAGLALLRQEVRLARQISHPHVCRVFDLGEVDAGSFLCMEYIDGEDLASLLRRIGRLPIDKALEIARQLAAGLAAVHEGGLLHRDLKPGNVMIDGRGRARITDFGLAVLADEPGGGRWAGTPAYMAPEQLAGEAASVQSDLYSLGLVLYEVLTGRRAAESEERPGSPVLPARVAEEIGEQATGILLRCLETSPQRRPGSALEVLAALSKTPGDGPPATKASPRAGWLRRRARILGYGGREAALSLAGMVLLGIWWRSSTALSDLAGGIPKRGQLGITGALALVSGVFLLLAFRRIWRRVAAPPIHDSGEPKLPALKGAASFGPQDADLFARLGRGDELERLRSWILDEEKPLVVLMGESGVGKTSLLRAGLAHTMERDGLPVTYWEALPAEPEAGLLHAVRSRWAGAGAAPESFASLAKAAAASRQVVVIDQLEQLSLERHAAIFDLLREIVLASPPHLATWVVAFRREYAGSWFDFELTLPEHARGRLDKLSIQRFLRPAAEKVAAVLVQEAKLPIEPKVIAELVAGLAIDGRVSPVDIGISLLVLGELAGEGGKASFSLEDFRVSGGETGLLTRYLERVLCQFPEADREELLLALLELTDLDKDQRIAEGKELSALEERIQPAFPIRFAAALKYLASGKARVLENLSAPEAEPRYRLIHERLIAALRALSGVQLAGANKARLVLDSAYRLWTKERKRRHLLSGEDLRLVLRYRGQFPWGDDESGKRDFVGRSRRRRQGFRALGAVGCLALIGLGLGVRHNLEKRELEGSLAGAGLPADLDERLDQFEVLELGTAVKTVDWLGAAKNLKDLTIGDCQATSLAGLPRGLQHLSLSTSKAIKLGDLKRLPPRLRSLTLSNFEVRSLAGIPAGLQSLSINDSSITDLAGLPAGLQSLSLTNSLLQVSPGLPAESLPYPTLPSLAGLPSGLKSLRIENYSIKSFAGLPPGLRSLGLVFTKAPHPTITNLLPPGLQHLSLSNGTVDNLRWLPRGIRSLSLSSITIKSLDWLPSDLQALSLSGTHVTSLTGLPPGLQSLSFSGETITNLVGLPPNLKSLKLAFTSNLDGHIIDLSGLPPQLQSFSLKFSAFSDKPAINLAMLPRGLRLLDLTCGIGSLVGLPPWLQSLSIRSLFVTSPTGVTSLAGLPPGLKSLSLSGSDMASLAGLPPGLQSLDLSYSRSLTSFGKLPSGLQEINLWSSRVSSLKGLPADLRILSLPGSSDQFFPRDRSRGLRSLEGLPLHLEELIVGKYDLETLKGLPKSFKKLRINPGPKAPSPDFEEIP